MTNPNIRLGCDPELFVFDNKLDRLVPACGLVPGTKMEPYPLEGGSVQVDGTLIEIGIDPASSTAEFISNLKSVLKQVQGILDKEPGRYQLRCGGLARYCEEDIGSTPKEAFEIGCKPDYTILGSVGSGTFSNMGIRDNELVDNRGEGKLPPEVISISDLPRELISPHTNI